MNTEFLISDEFLNAVKPKRRASFEFKRHKNEEKPKFTESQGSEPIVEGFDVNVQVNRRMSRYNVRPPSEWLVKYDIKAKLKDVVNTKDSEIKGMALLKKLIFLSKEKAMEEALFSD